MINNKIYELAKQADLIEFDYIPGSKAMTPSYESIVKARKFAELIVQECAEIASEETSLPYDSYSEKIKQHFGVKE